MDEFLKPQSMLTPGIAGALAMFLTNALTSGFGVQSQPYPALICLIISFVIGLVVFGSTIKPFWRKFVYYGLNSLIIFAVAMGTNTTGLAVMQDETKQQQTTAVRESVDKPALPKIATMRAKSTSASGWCCLNNKVNTSSKAECDKWGGKYFKSRAEAQAACKPQDNRETQPTRFFKKWL